MMFVILLLCILSLPAHASQSFESRAQDLIKTGQALMREGKTGEAQLFFQKARAIHHLLSKQFTDIGQTHFEQGALDTAKIAFKRALEFDTQNPLPNLGLGRTYLREKNYKDAMTYLARALLLNPDLSDARDLLRQTIKKHGQSDLTSHLRHYTFPCQALAFKDGNSLRVEIAYALPKVGLAAAGGVGVVHIDQHLSFQNETDTAILSFLERPSYLREVGREFLRENYLLGTQTVRIPLKTYQLSLNITDRKIASRGTFQTVCRPPTDEIDFGMGDLLIARNITSKIPYPETRTDLQIEPNPLRLYRQSEPVFVYLELYNLLSTLSGLTDYELSYTFRWPDPQEIDLRHFEALDRNLPLNVPEGLAALQFMVPHQHRGGIVIDSEMSPDRATRVTIPYTGTQSDDFTYLQLNIDHLEPGIHKLVISAHDLVAETTVQRSTLLRIAK